MKCLQRCLNIRPIAAPAPVVAAAIEAMEIKNTPFRNPDYIKVNFLRKKPATTVDQVVAPVEQTASTPAPKPETPAAVEQPAPAPVVEATAVIEKPAAAIDLSPADMKAYILDSNTCNFRLERADGRVFSYHVERWRTETGTNRAVKLCVEEVQHYLGTVFPNGNFSSTKGTSMHHMDDARFFGNLWRAMMIGTMLEGIRPTTRESRAAELKAASAARKAAEAAEKLTADMAKLAAQDTKPLPTAAAQDAIRLALAMISADDPDRAKRTNDRGFSKSDTVRGNHLSRKVGEFTEEEWRVARQFCWRYRRQLPKDLVALAMDA